MANDKNILGQLTDTGNDALGLINRLDDASAKFQKGKRKGSIIKSAQGNVFEFPVFISNSVTVDYATATSSLLEQLYSSYLQMAISINPVVTADSVKRGLQFADLKTDTNKYLEYTDMSYAHDACHNVIQEGAYTLEFNMLSIEDSDARVINEAVDHQPLSEFDHFFQEAEVNLDDMQDVLYPFPYVTRDQTTGQDMIQHLGTYNVIGPGSVVWMTAPEIMDTLRDTVRYNIPLADIEEAIQRLPGTLDHYHFNAVSTHDLNNATSDSDRNEMMAARNACSNITPDALARNRPLIDRINDLDSRYPGFADEMNALTQNVARAAALATREDQIHDLRYGTHGGISAADDIANERIINAQRARQATSRYNNAMNAIDTGAKTVNDIIGVANSAANAVKNTTDAIYNIKTFKTRQENEELRNKQLKSTLDNLENDRRLRTNEVNAKVAASLKAPQYVDDGKCQKLNTMKPLLMQVTLSMINKDDTLQPINYIIGVKTHSRVIPASILPEVAKYPLKEMDKISRKIKWRAGELKFFKDLVFRINEKKQTAADSRDPKRKWYRRLYELAHMKGDAPAAAVVQGKSIFASFIRDKQGKSKMLHGVIPNASIIMSQADVDNIKNQTDIDLLKGSAARKFCGELFLISLVIIDTDAESIKLMLPDMHNDFEVHSLASVNKQLATLDTAGTKTRDMFKLLG